MSEGRLRGSDNQYHLSDACPTRAFTGRPSKRMPVLLKVLPITPVGSSPCSWPAASASNCMSSGPRPPPAETDHFVRLPPPPPPPPPPRLPLPHFSLHHASKEYHSRLLFVGDFIFIAFKFDLVTLLISHYHRWSSSFQLPYYRCYRCVSCNFERQPKFGFPCRLKKS